MKQSIVKELTLDEVKARITEEKEILVKLRISHAVSPVDNPIKIRSTRKLIARLKTELNKRTREAAAKN